MAPQTPTSFRLSLDTLAMIDSLRASGESRADVITRAIQSLAASCNTNVVTLEDLATILDDMRIRIDQLAAAKPAETPTVARVEPDPAPPLTDTEMAAHLGMTEADLDELAVDLGYLPPPSAAATPNPEPTPATEPEPTPTKRGGRKPDPARDAAWQQAIAMNDQGKSKDSIVAFLNDHGIKTSPGNLSRDMRKARDRLAGITPSAPADQEIGPNTVS